MSDYIYSNGQFYEVTDTELSHAWLKKGEKADKHKYIKREWKNGRWRYTYPYVSNNKSIKDVNVKKDNIFTNRIKATFENGKSFVHDKLDVIVEKNMTKTEQKYSSIKEKIPSWNNTQIDTGKKFCEQVLIGNRGSDKRSAQETFSSTTVGNFKDSVTEFVDAVNYLFPGTFKRSKKVQQKLDSELKKQLEDLEKIRHQDQLDLNFKEHGTTPSEDMYLVNPKHYTEDRELYDQNCAACTIAYDLRRRGYDVEAESELATANDGTGTIGMTISDIASCYSYDLEVVDSFYKSRIIQDRRTLQEQYKSDGKISTDLNNLETEFLSYGNGARGNLCVYWNDGGAHSVSWEVQNNKVIIRDCQTSVTHNFKYFEDRINDFEYFRTDVAKPRQKILQYVKNRER